MRKTFVRTLLLLATLLCGLATFAAEPLCFVQLSDLHLGYPGSLEAAKTIAKDINALPFDVSFVAITGDVYDKSASEPELDKDFDALLKSFKAPVYAIPGNHDIRPGSEERNKEDFERVAGPLCKNVEVKGWQLIFFFAETLPGKMRLEGYEPMPWLESALKAASDRRALIFLHTPPFDEVSGGKLHKSPWSPESRAEFSQLLRKYSVAAVICGHLHRDMMRWDGATPVFAAPPVTPKYGRQPTWRIYTLSPDGRLDYMTQYLPRPQAN